MKNLLEIEIGEVWVEGEISNLRRQASGHCYFSLKDDGAQISCVLFRGSAAKAKAQPEDGMQARLYGEVSVYEARGQVQLIVKQVEDAGLGDLQAKFEALKRKLDAEGLFDPAAKKPLPKFPKTVGLITSPTGAALQDMLNILKRRAPWVQPVLYPVSVQGKGAEVAIARAIDQLGNPESHDLPRVDVIIAGRGGGSLEDLWAFNEEAVVRAAAESFIPLISAVGHETDWTLIDLASDQRAPTPTAAAEMAVPVRYDVMAQVADCEGRMIRAVRRHTETARREVEGLSRGLPNLRRVIEDASQRLDDWSERLSNGLRAGVRQRRARIPTRIPKPDQLIVQARRHLQGETEDLTRAVTVQLAHRKKSLTHVSQLLESFSYERVLDRGFALITSASGEPLTSVKNLKSGDDVNIRLKDGSEAARIIGGKTVPRPKHKPSPPKGGDDPQGTLI